jgi:hypothetical protein
MDPFEECRLMTCWTLKYHHDASRHRTISIFPGSLLILLCNQCPPPIWQLQVWFLSLWMSPFVSKYSQESSLFPSPHCLWDSSVSLSPLLPALITPFVYILGSTGVWTQGLVLLGKHSALKPRPSPSWLFLLVHTWHHASWLVCPLSRACTLRLFLLTCNK